MDADGGKYAAQIDLSNDNDSHALMVRMVGGGKRVLDVGCWTGDMGTEFARFNPRVVGIEIDTAAAERAKKVLDDVIVADVTTLDFAQVFGQDAFDVIVFGDVLEHVTDPVAVLRAGRAALADDGFVVASIPNVAHGSIRLRLLSGEFSYTEVGLLDRTHVRFFTLDTVRELFHEAGFAVVDLQRTTIDPLLAPEHPIDAATVPADVLEGLRADPEALTYQFVVKAVVDDRSLAIRRLSERAAALEARLATSTAGRAAGVDEVRLAFVVDDADRLPRLALDVMAQEFQRRLAPRSVDYRVVTPATGVIPGWAPDVVVGINHDIPADRTPAGTVTTMHLDADGVATVGLLAARLASRADLQAARVLLRSLGRYPDDRPLVVSMSTDASNDLAAELIDGLLTDESAPIVVVHHHPLDPVVRNQLEARGRSRVCVVDAPDDPVELLAIFGNAVGVVSDSAFEQRAAQSLGVAGSPLTDPATVIDELDRAAGRLADGSTTHDELRIEQIIETAIRDLTALADTDTEEGRDQPLLQAHRALQARILRERRAMAAMVGELEADIVRRDDRIARLEHATRDLAELDALLEAQHVAVVALQEVGHDAAEGGTSGTRRSFLRRAVGKLRRSLRR